MATEKPLDGLRREYTGRAISPETVAQDPVDQFSKWYREAEEIESVEANAVCLGTTSSDGIPSTRIVLLKQFGKDGFVFFTNYESRKANELDSTDAASLLFFWPVTSRQVRITGSVERTSRALSEEYFASRPRGSQLGAWASKQSSEVPTRADLENAFEQRRMEFEGKDVPCPPFWGGYCVSPDVYEFWQGKENRLHERVQYRLVDGLWVRTRLSP